MNATLFLMLSDFAVQCKEREGTNATEISLAENLLKEDMHPVDQFEAFSALAGQGKSVTDIAARFGTSETIVRRRLALARVSPVLLQLYRDEDMSFEQLCAFTVSDDHKRQEEVWNSLPQFDRHASTIRRVLTNEAVSASDKRMAFIGGLDAYEAAGGTVKRDLFDTRNDGYATDAALVEKLVADKLAAEAQSVRAEGWQWVECHCQPPEDFYRFQRLYPETLPLSQASQAELDQLTEDYDALADLINGDAADEGAEDKLAVIERRMDELQAGAEIYAPETLAQAGAIVTLGYCGELRIERGLVRPGDRQTRAQDVADQAGEEGAALGDGERGEPVKPAHSAALIEDLTAHKSAALRIELANNCDVALAAVVHAMLLSVAYPYARTQSALEIRLTSARLETHMKDPASSTALATMEDTASRWGEHLPGDPADLWDWLLEQRQDELLSLLAFAAAQSLNAVETRCGGARKAAFADANQLGAALNVDMAGWFAATGESYFRHVSRSVIEQAVSEAKGADAALAVRAAGKKAEAATIAERLVKDTGWLPGPVRIVTPAADDETAQDAAESIVIANDDASPFAVAAE